MEKQNSVEWLAQTIYDKMKMKGDGKVFQGILDEAKAMHKEEIVNAYQAGDGDAYNLDETRDFGEQYYNETFGGNNETH